MPENKIQALTFTFRVRMFVRLLFDLRRHDFRSANTFMAMSFPNDSRPMRMIKFVSWALKQMWCDIPEAMVHTTFAKEVSKVPYWLDDGNPLENYPWADNPDTQLPQRVDTVVIGCGLAGSALAYHWGKNASPDQKLAVLDMWDAATGSAGRNEGLVVMGRYYYMVFNTVLLNIKQVRRDLTGEQQEKLAHKFAASYSNACYSNGDMVEQTIIEENFDCDYAREGWVQATDEEDQTKLADSVKMAIDTDFTDWTSITPEKVKELTGMNVRHNAGFSIAAATFHPAKWCWSLLEHALATGKVQLFSRTKASQVEDLGDEYAVHTPRGVIHAKHIVVATESYTPMLYPQFHDAMRPTQTQAAYGDGGPDELKPHVGVSNARAFFGRHGKKVFVGSDATRVPDHEAGRIQPSRFLTRFVCGELHKAFGPSPYNITNEWSGTVTYTPDEFPILGIFDGKRQYIIGGMAGSGTAVSFNGARCIINRILGNTHEPDDYPEEFFSPTRILDPANHNWSKVED
jgi:glycine/D-amino acid oxidase-like deaminating enzyme